jgi:hypothetical protein
MSPNKSLHWNIATLRYAKSRELSRYEVGRQIDA